MKIKIKKFLKIQFFFLEMEIKRTHLVFVLKNPGLAASVVHSAVKVTFTFISLSAVEKYMIYFMSFHVFSTVRYSLPFTTCQLCVAFGSIPRQAWSCCSF